MKVGYMTNAWGSVVGSPGGVTSGKDLFYCSTGGDQEAISAISGGGFERIEIFDGNLMAYRGNPEIFRALLEKHHSTLLSVYTGANFIFDDIYPEELYKIEQTAALAGELGAKHLVIGGGALRSGGVQDQDYKLLGKRLDEAGQIARKYNLIPTYHPHLGSLVQAPDELDKIMTLTSIDLCPDTGHLTAGGGDAAQIVEKYIKRIPYIHLKDYQDGKFLPLGAGNVNIGKIIQLAQDTSQEIDFTVEADGYEGSPIEAAQTSYQFLKSFFRA